jgi:GT2 family glycosyltransferase
MPKLSVVLCTLLDADEVAPLRAFESDEFDDYEVIVRQDEGLSVARNRGIHEASSDFILFIDDDAYPCEGYLERAVAGLEEYPIVGGRVIDPTGSLPSSARDLYDQGDEPKLTSRVVGCNMAFRREVFETVGLFDENFEWGHEETDLVRRAVRAGFDVYYDPEMSVVHTYADGTRDYWRTMYRYGLSDVYYDRKKGIPEWRRLHWYIPVRRGSTLRDTVVESIAAMYRSAGRLHALIRGVPSTTVDRTRPSLTNLPDN